MMVWAVRRPFLLALVFVLGFLLPASLHADDQALLRAARLTYFEGDVKIARADNTGSSAAVTNMPLSEGTRITTGESGQAEIEFEDGSLVRLTPFTSLSLTKLSVEDEVFKSNLALLNGLAYAELRASSKYVYRLDAGGDVLSPVQNVTMRVNLDTPPAEIAVLDGTAHVERVGADGSGGYHSDIQAGETLRADPADTSRYFLNVGVSENSWDAWNEDRDQFAADQAARGTGARDDFAGSQGYGWSDLDANGSWYDVPGQGKVWQPDVAQDPDFDPYGYGSWVWYPGMGYVWASGYSWGWTPFRCGGWSYWDGFGWGWAPGVGCGYTGWGLGGGGVYIINVILPPRGYHFLPLPGRGPAGVHPIVPVRPGHGLQPPAEPRQGPVNIAGHVVEPLRPAGVATLARGGSTVGAALRRDYPVDRTSHQPVLGQTPVAARPVYSGYAPSGSYGERQQVPRQGTINYGQMPRYSTPPSSPPPRPAPPPRSSPPSAPAPSHPASSGAKPK